MRKKKQKSLNLATKSLPLPSLVLFAYICIYIKQTKLSGPCLVPIRSKSRVPTIWVYCLLSIFPAYFSIWLIYENSCWPRQHDY